MPTKVRVGNDVVTFPDGMTDEQMSAALAKEYGSPATPPETEPVETKPNFALGMYKGISTPMDNINVWAKNAAGRVVGPEMADRADRALHSGKSIEELRGEHAAHIEQRAAEGKRPGLIGEIAGNTAVALPALAVTKNPWLAGGFTGALNTKDPNDAQGVAIDAALGAAFGKGGDVATRAIGGVVAPRINPLVQKLLDKGIELTPGQILGGLAHRAEDATKTIYGVGDMIIGAQARGQKSMVRAAVQDTLDPIGVKIPKDLDGHGHKQVEFAQTQLSGAYDKVLAAVPPVHLDPAFSTNVANLKTLTRQLGADQRNTFDQIFNGHVRQAFNPQTGAASGRGLKDLDSFLGGRARDFAKSGNPYDRDLSRSITELQSEIRDLIGRQHPVHKATIDAVNEGWAKLLRVEAAAGPAKGGNFTAEQLRQAALQKASGMKNKATARGEALMQDFGDAASQVMSSTVGDSGTMTRALASGVAGAALFGKNLGHLQPNPWLLSLLGAASAPYANKATGRVARAVIARRPAGAAAARGIIEKASPVAAVAAGGEPARNR